MTKITSIFNKSHSICTNAQDILHNIHYRSQDNSFNFQENLNGKNAEICSKNSIINFSIKKIPNHDAVEILTLERTNASEKPIVKLLHKSKLIRKYADDFKSFEGCLIVKNVYTDEVFIIGESEVNDFIFENESEKGYQ